MTLKCQSYSNSSGVTARFNGMIDFLCTSRGIALRISAKTNIMNQIPTVFENVTYATKEDHDQFYERVYHGPLHKYR